MSQQEREKAENLRELLRQHWLHCRHLESERAWFMSVYAAITGGMFTFMAYLASQAWWSLLFLVWFAFVGFFLTIRWTYAFECHRKKVNKLARVLWLESRVEVSLDPTMDIPAMHILPKFIYRKKVPDRLQRIVNELFRTRYWFALFYLLILIFLVIFSFIAGFSLWSQVIAITASLIALFLGVRWYSSLKEMENGNRDNDST